MTSAAFDRLNSGYWNPGLRSSANPGGLSGTGAMRVNWPLVLDDLAAVAAETAASQAMAAAYAAAAVSAPGTKATSGTNIVIPFGAVPASKAFTVAEADRLFVPGQTIVMASTADPLKQMVGPLTAFDAAAKTGTFQVQFASAAGTYAAWTIALAPSIDETLTGRVTALEAEAARLTRRHRLFNKDLL